MDHQPTPSTFDVYAVRGSSSRVVALRSIRGLAAGDASCWVQLCNLGEYKGHAMGAFAFTPDVFASIIKNFNAQANPVPVTYEHGMTPGQPRPAAGWVQEIKQDGEWLVGLVEWTPSAAKMIRDGEYRFCSVCVDFESIDRVSGEPIGPEMYELGLTNTPFIDGQEPIRLSRSAAGARKELTKMDPQKMISGVSKALGLAADAPKEKVVEMLSAIYDFVAAMTGKSPEDVMESVAGEAEVEMTARVAKLAKVRKLMDEVMPPDLARKCADGAEAEAAGSMVLTKLLDATGMDEAALVAALESNLDAVVAALGGAPASGMPSDSDAVTASRALSARLEASDAKVRKLEARIAEFEKADAEKREAETKARIDEAIKSGHILETARATFTELARTSPKLFDEMLGHASKQPAVKLGRVITAHQPAGDDAPSTEDERRFLSALPRHVTKEKRTAMLADYRKLRSV